MDHIVAPLNPGDTGPQVANLQDALRLLLDHSVILIRSLEPSNRPTAEELAKLEKGLAKERAQSVYGNATQRLVRYVQLQEGLGDNLGGAVEANTAARLNEILTGLGAFDATQGPVVRGTVRDANGNPMPGVVVRAIDRDLRHWELLGRPTVTKERGDYEIPYAAEQFARAESGGPDIQIQAFDSDTLDRLLAESTVLFNAGSEATIDLTLPDATTERPSDFEIEHAKVTRVLKSQADDGSDLTVAELTPPQIDFIASDTGIARQHIVWLQAAHQTGAELKHEFGAACCYGWFRLGMSTEPATLWATAVPRLVQALKDAIARQIVSAGISTAIDAIEAAIRRRQATLALQAPRFGSGGAAASLGDMLTLLSTPLNIKGQLALAAVADELQPDDPKLVELIAAIPGLDGEAPGVARALRLGALTEGNLPLARALQERVADDMGGTLRSLTGLRADQWIDLAYAHGVPEGVGFAPAEYAADMEAGVERAHPTAALGVHVEGRRLGRQPALAPVAHFLRNNPSFDITTANLRSPDKELDLAGIDEPKKLFDGLRGLQRMQMLGARWSETAVLYENGIISPHRIVMEGPTRLIVLLDGQISPERVNDLYDDAREMYATTLGGYTAAFWPLSGPTPLPGGLILEGDLAPDPDTGGETGLDPRGEWDAVLRNKGISPRDLSIVPRVVVEGRTLPDDAPIPKEIKKYVLEEPTLQGLFGPQDSCACKHCLSVLSPAAYFVDVLQFLKDAGRLSTLFARRPDMQDLELSCENTDTPVPTIDLVLEILENAAALPLPIPLPAGIDAETELSGPTVGASVREALEKTVRALKGTVRATPAGSSEAGTSDWTVVDGHRRWTLTVQKKSLRALNVAGTTIPLETAGLNVATIVAALNGGQVAPGADAAFAALLGGRQASPPDLTNYQFTITKLLTDRVWRLVYRCVADLEIDAARSTLLLRTPAGGVWFRNTYDRRTITALAAELRDTKKSWLVSTLLADRFPGVKSFTFEAAEPNRWRAASADRALTLSYTPVGLTISALAYQSGDAAVDAIAWPENHNPAAYALLKAQGVSFPWSLPVDLPLEEVRLFLARARSSRLALIELMRPLDQSGKGPAWVREVLGLSEAEATLIAPPTAPTADQVFAHWGLTANRTRLWDAAAGKNATAADALGLLKIVSVLLQQSRLSFEDLEAVLATGFVQPSGPTSLVIAQRDTCVPSDMRIDALSRDHLELMHRFVRLWRRLGWSIADVATAIQAVAGGVLDADALAKLADLVQLVDVLDLPVATVLPWWSDPSAEGGRKRERELARALKITAVDLGNATALFEIADVFVSPAETLRLGEKVAAVRRRGIGFGDLRYLLRNDPAPASDVELTKSTLDALVAAARDAVRSIPETAGTTAPLDPAQPAGAKAVDAIVAALASRLGATRELVDDVLRTRLHHPTAVAQPAVAVMLDNAFFTPEQPPPLPATPVETVVVRLYRAITLCSALGLGAAELRMLRRTPTEAAGLIALDFNTLPSPAAPAPSSITAFEQLLALLDVRDLAPGTAALLRQYATLRFTDAALAQNARRLLAAGLARGLIADDEEQVRLAALRLKIDTAEKYRDPLALLRLMKLLLALEQLDAKVSDVEGFIADSPTDAQALKAREVLRTKFSDSSWREIVKPIADKLRQRQADALVDYLIARDNLRDDGIPSDPGLVPPPHLRGADDLYEYYLIDVQTGSCMTTTRLLAATAAVQLFVQRCMLNLEGRVRMSQEKRDLWSWMHRYRVWEANRKVFLFPENWLLPELRDDQTVLARQMMGALTDQEPTLESTRDALIGYLDELAEHGQISTVALYDHRQQLDGGGEDRTLYIVGRTPNEAFRYFWRCCAHFGDQSTMFWSGWEPLELDNANDYVMPFMFQGDLHIAWPTFRSTTFDESRSDPRSGAAWEVKLAWIRRTARGWTKRKFGKEALFTPRLPNKTTEDSFVFRLGHQRVSNDGLDLRALNSVQVDCYAAQELTSEEKEAAKQATKLETKATAAPIQPPFGGLTLYDSWVTITFIAKGTFTLKNWPGDLSEDLNATVRLKWRRHPHRADGSVPEGSRSAEVKDDFAPGTVELWAAHGHEITATFSYPGQADVQPSKVTIADPDAKYIYWNVQFQAVFNLGELEQSPSGRLNSLRPVNYVPAGAFSLDSLRDVSVKGASGKALDLMLKGTTVGGKIVVTGNGFTFDALASDLPVPKGAVTKIDRGKLDQVTLIPAGPFGPNGTSIEAYPTAPLVLYIRDQTRRFYLSATNSEKFACPDGHPFVGWYRRRTAESTFGIFAREVQAKLLDVLDAAPPQNVLRTVNPAISFHRRDTYANYNWELFLHLPLAAADYLAKQHRCADARRWLHAVFDPTAEPTPKEGRGFWKFLPFDNASRPEAIAKLLAWLIDPNVNDPTMEAGLMSEIGLWKLNPFMPHVIARLRPSAYQWYTFFAYVELLIGCGDQLYRKYTRESVNEATLFYVMAAKMLGPRPRDIPADGAKPPQTYRSLPKDSDGNLAQFSDAWLGPVGQPGMNKILLTKASSKKRAFSTGSGSIRRAQGSAVGIPPAIEGSESAPPGGHEVLASLGSLAFCIPRNSKIDELHDLVERRLFDIRHCRNIEGVSRELPLFDPPIDPLLLIKAKAAGLDLDALLSSYPEATPHYRFSAMLQKANGLASEVKALGAALLAALEKKDAEDLSLLRSRHEIALLNLVRDTRQRQIDEADAAIVALQQSKETAQERFAQYQKLLGKASPTKGQDGLPVVEQASALSVSTDNAGEASGLGLVRKEVDQLSLSKEAHNFTLVANVLHIVSGVAHAVPNFGIGTSPYVTHFGGSNVGSALGALAKAFEMIAADKSFAAGRQGTLAGYERRQDEWVHQSKLALAELKQLDKQILVATIRRDIAKKELASHEAQIENAKEVEDFFRDKFTNKELYRWMSSRLAEVYFRGYQLALDVAQRTELAFWNELGEPKVRVHHVQSSSWDSLKKGLLAAEQLSLDLKRMEAAYFDQNRREYEITKHVSLAQLDPVALIVLKETGKCSISIPEVLFDLDYPGHYFRRLKSAAISIPCVTGPYVGVNCTLTLKRHAYRRDGTVAIGENYEANPYTDGRFRQVVAPQAMQAVVTSSGQSDTGLFETNLRDERYLPFEGAGAISDWGIDLADDFRAFDYGTISDVILHLRFTARDGESDLKIAAQDQLVAALNDVVGTSGEGLTRVFSLRHEFASEWYRFMNPPESATGDLTMTLPLAKDRFPAIFRDPRVSLTFSSFDVLAAVKPDYLASHRLETIKLSLRAGSTPPTAAPALITWPQAPRFVKGEVAAAGPPGSWTLAGWLQEDPDRPNDHSRLDPSALEEVLLICRYSCAVR